jgi:hypothetical protein
MRGPHSKEHQEEEKSDAPCALHGAAAKSGLRLGFKLALMASSFPS